MIRRLMSQDYLLIFISHPIQMAKSLGWAITDMSINIEAWGRDEELFFCVSDLSGISGL